jgi:hypothetical protein
MGSSDGRFITRLSIHLGWWLAAPALASAQNLLAGLSTGGRIFNTDMAVLEMQEPRKDLPCSVMPAKAALGFDLRFHAGYEVTIPLRELSGSENTLTILFRILPENRKDEPTYFTHRVKVPSIEEEAKGDAYLQGSFDLGEGKYHVDWLMRDRAERVCSHYWDAEATLPSKDKSINLVIPPGAIQASENEDFKEEPPIERSADNPLVVKVLINFAPQNSRSAMLKPVDTTALVSILRQISRDPRIGKFSIIAFNLQEQRTVYRQEEADRIDFPKLGDALNSLNLGTVDLKRLANKTGEVDFLTDLIRTEAGGEKPTDALIFAGPKALLDSNVPQEELKEVGDLAFPVFYMNFNLTPQSTPWRDAIGNAVKFFKGTEYTITRPRDLWFSVSEMVSRIVKSKHDRNASADSSK